MLFSLETELKHSSTREYELLAAAIIERAILDYIELTTALMYSCLNEKEKIIERDRILMFFRSNWFDMLCPIDMSGNDLIKTLNKEIERRESD